jgi:uncharacterized LabA/DUF88 family protein
MSENNSTTHVSQEKTILSRLGGMLMRIVHIFLTLPQTSHVAVVALLIDGENISPDLTAQMLVEAGMFGGVMIRRVYGNVTSPNMQGWKEVMTHYALQGMHQMQTVTGKNAADIALAIDAMDLFYRDHVTRFCIVGSDSDYTPLVLRLRSAGCMVIGIGEPKTPSALVKAYTVFVSTDQLAQRLARTKPTVVSSTKVAPTAQLPTTKKKIAPPTLAINPNKELPALLSRAYKEATKGKESEWMLISQLGTVLRKIDPSFKPTDYSQKDLSSLLMKHEDLFEIRKRSGKGGHLELRLRK